MKQSIHTMNIPSISHGLMFLFVFLCLLVTIHCEPYPRTEYQIRTRILNFVPVIPEPRQATFITKDEAAEVHVDAAYTETVLIDIVQHLYGSVVNFNAYCYVQDLLPEYTITKFQWCYKRNIEDVESCPEMQQTEFTVGRVNFIAFLDSQYGVRIQSRWDNVFSSFEPTRPDISGFYWCRLTNRLGTANSPLFQFRDFMKERIMLLNFYNYVTKKVAAVKKVIQPSDLPYNFHCSGPNVTITGTPPVASSIQLLSPFYWTLCALSSTAKVTTISAYQCLSATQNINSDIDIVPLKDFGETTLHLNGTLTLLKMKDTMRNAVLLCRAPKAEWINFIGDSVTTDIAVRPVQFNPKGTEYSGPPMALSSTSNMVKLRAGVNTTIGPFPEFMRISAIYRAQPSVKYEWKQGNTLLAAPFKTDEYHLVFPPLITPQLQGIYTLTIGGTLSFQFDVKVDLPANITNSDAIPKETFRINGGSVSITYAITGQPSRKDILINGFQLRLENKQSLQDTISFLPRSPADKLRFLSANVSPLGTTELMGADTVTYSVDNLVFTSYDQFGQSHAITLVASNSVGESRLTSVIKVLPTPDPIDYPAQNPCSGSKCLPTKEHAFHCNFGLTKYRNEGVFYRIFWFFKSKPGNDTGILLGDVSTDSVQVEPGNSSTVSKTLTSAELNKYFRLEMNNETLVLRDYRNYPKNATNMTASVTDLKMDEALKNASVTCRLLLLKPDAVAFDGSGNLSVFLDSKYLLFDSNDPQYAKRNLMTAPIALYPGDPATASYGWIAAVIVIIIIIAIVIIILVYFCTRDKKETYKVDNEEREHGHDPLKEIKENEEFHTYERGDDSMNYANSPNGYSFNPREEPTRHSLDGSVGIHSGDEHELDEYDNLNDKNFNEDGSFINEYRQNSSNPSASHDKAVFLPPNRFNSPDDTQV